MTKILLVGCGKMGSALLAGWLQQGVQPQDCVVVDPRARDVPAGVTVIGDSDLLAKTFTPDVTVLAVKPQVMADVLPAYARLAGQTVFLSIAAGKPIAFFQKLLGGRAAVVRAMPNTPAAVQRGITVCFAGAGIDQSARDLCETLLSAVGEVGWIEDEDLMDAVTAVSGSGPAYVFLLAEVMAEAGKRAGLPADLADRLARATVAGAGELLHRSAESSAQLRINVTSPGGTTAAALGVLTDPDRGMEPLMVEAAAAAVKRGRELAG